MARESHCYNSTPHKATSNETDLEICWISSKKVVVQIPGTDEYRFLPDWKKLGYSKPAMNMSATVAVPEHHITFVNFLFQDFVTFYCRRDPVLSLMAYVTPPLHSKPSKRWLFCMSYDLDSVDPDSLPVVVEARWFVVHMTDVQRLTRRQAFVMAFSFHENSSPLLHKLASGQWNCSVSHWPDFDFHFRCDVVKDCEGGEDEIDCTYTGHCGQGRLEINDQCYQYVTATEVVSWFDAQSDCVKRGGYLASLNSKEEWDSVNAFLRKRRKLHSWFLGIRNTLSNLPTYYVETFMWEDHTIALYVRVFWETTRNLLRCGRQSGDSEYDYALISVPCDRLLSTSMYLCEFNKPTSFNVSLPKMRLPLILKTTAMPFPHTHCPSGHVTHQFLACDSTSACWAVHGQLSFDDVGQVNGRPLPSSCPADVTFLPPSFRCQSGQSDVAYSLVCDSRDDCLDRSDEVFCHFPTCPPHTPFACASGGRCLPETMVCDKQRDCHGAGDELYCKQEFAFKSAREHLALADSLVPPIIVYYNQTQKQLGFYAQTIDNISSPCPAETHFLCAGGSHCLPVYVICNGVYDCLHRDDEHECKTYTCPSYYRCRGSSVCLHAQHLCDGSYHCPQKDDELCDWHCPPDCTCQGHAYVCGQAFPADQYSQVRYLDASHSDMTPHYLVNNTLLIFLSLHNCHLHHLDHFTFINLRVLDVSDNQIQDVNVDQLSLMINLKTLVLADNPLVSAHLFPDSGISFQIKTLVSLNLAHVALKEIHSDMFKSFPNLNHLNFSHSGIRIISGDGLKMARRLHILDLRGCPVIHFPREVFEDLHELRKVFADNYKLCCSLTLPKGFNPKNCRAPFNEVSSCDALLRASLYRVILAVYAIFSLLGNLTSFLTRMLWFKSSGKSGFAVFVTHLSISDFLMGIYLSVVGVADRLYMGNYLWEDVTWRHSVICKVAGFLSLLSNEMSALVVCVITLDRFLALRFPFSRVKFNPGSALVVSLCMWLVSGLLATVPLLDITEHWNFYSQTGMCVPLPVTRSDFAGHSYAFGLIIILNFVLFLLITLGQVSIYLSIRASAMSMANSTRRSQDLKIARHLITIAMSDFACWFPIGLLGLLASRGVPVPGEINVAMAVVVLPLNSALNPFLYNLSVVMEKRRQGREERLLKIMTAEIEKE